MTGNRQAAINRLCSQVKFRAFVWRAVSIEINGAVFTFLPPINSSFTPLVKILLLDIAAFILGHYTSCDTLNETRN